MGPALVNLRTVQIFFFKLLFWSSSVFVALARRGLYLSDYVGTERSDGRVVTFGLSNHLCNELQLV